MSTLMLTTGSILTFNSSFNQGSKVDIEILALQSTEPLPGPNGIYVPWRVSRGIAEVNPILTRIKHACRHQFVVIFESRESPAASYWYVCEASDVKENTRNLLGTGKTPQEAFDNFCERASVVLSDHPDDIERANSYSDGDPETLGNMRTQALRCFKPMD